MYKFSRYNHLIENGNNVILYNLISEKILALQLQTAKILKDHQDNVGNLKVIHPTFYQTLIKDGFIVKADVDEIEKMIKNWDNAETSQNEFSITILPTINCNLNCWYCYEKHDKAGIMKPTVLDRIQKLIQRITKKAELKHLELDFFGGEPFLCWKNVVWPLLEYTKQICDNRHKILSIHFTTNATLISKNIIESLDSLKTSTSFQITLDGRKDEHNAVRKTKLGKPTFDIIVGNIKFLLKKRMLVNCRLNYTTDTLYTFVDLIDDFKSLDSEDRKFLNFTFQQVWQDISKQETSQKEITENETAVIQAFRDNGFSTNLPSKYISRHCYADYENKIVVNYNGDLYKCTGRDFVPEIREGVLSEKGELLYNTIYQNRMALKRGSETCRKCIIYPICHCGCSQYVLDNHKKDETEQCLFNYSEKDKKTIIRNRLKAILNY